MATITQLSNLDLAKNELRNFAVQGLPSHPSSPVEGQVYYNTTDGTLYVYKAETSTWLDLRDSDTLDGESLSYVLDRGNHTGTQPIASVTGLQLALNEKADDPHLHAASDIASGTLAIPRGGTGLGSVPSGNYLRGTGGSSLVPRTPLDVRSDLNVYSMFQVDSLVGARQLLSQKNEPNGYAGLDGGGKLSPGQLPDLAISQTHVVADLAARDALSVEEGDVAVVTDAAPITAAGQPATFIWDGAAWVKMLTPEGGVQSVSGGTGIVSTGGTTPVISIANSGVGTTQIAPGAVQTTNLADNSVTLDKMSGNSVGTAQIIGGSITSTRLGNGAVITSKLANGAVTEEKLANELKSYTTTVNPSVSSTPQVTHNLGSRDVHVTVYRDASPYDEVMVQSRRVTVDRVDLHFAATPNEDFRVVVSR